MKHIMNEHEYQDFILEQLVQNQGYIQRFDTHINHILRLMSICL